MKTKYYFENEDSEFCLNEEGIKDIIKSKELTELEVFIAIPTKSIDMMYCTIAGDVGEKGFCGKSCKDYKPRNGKSGNCLYNRSTLYEKGDKTIIKILNK